MTVSKPKDKNSNHDNKKKPLATSKGSKTTSHKQGWNFYLEECQKFREAFGHCKIPTSYKDNKKLGIWVQEQRRNFKLFKQGKKPRVVLTDEQIGQLDAIEFHWGWKPDPNASAESDASWDANFAKLQDYYESHGDFNVPMESSSNEIKNLAKWARVQRQQKYLKVSKVKSFMTKPRENQLDAIGFDWNGPRKFD